MVSEQANPFSAQNLPILDMLSEGVYGLDEHYHITFANRVVHTLLGWDVAELIGQNALTLLHKVKPQGSPFPPGEHPISWVEAGGAIFNLEELLCCKDGTTLPVELSMTPCASDQINAATMVIVFRDISERKNYHRRLARAFHDMADINKNLDQARNQLQQSEKMVAVGQLAAGMAHEINNPIGFVQSNLGSLEKYAVTLLSLLDQYSELERQNQITPEDLSRIRDLKSVIDFDFLREDLISLLNESRQGIARVRKVVQGLREFSQEGKANEWSWLDVQHSLENVLDMMQGEINEKCILHCAFGKTPEIYCLPSQINYVFMCLIKNAIQSISDHGSLAITTGTTGNEVWIEIADSGCGMAPEVLAHVFEPFFTTQAVGSGSGMGLATSYGIIKAHRGSIDVSSRQGKGTSVIVRLPVQSD